MQSDDKTITGAQLRAARALLRWSAGDLAERSSLGVATIRRAEAQDGLISATPANIRAMRTALEDAGVQLIPQNGGGPGVRLKRQGPPDEGLRPGELTSENDG
jgi:transcriptional regulator with XRE-family HTH domain